MTPNIDINDIRVKQNNARKFLNKGHKVRLVLRFKGREIMYINEKKKVLFDFVKGLEDICKIESDLKQENRIVSIVIVKK